MALVSPGVEVSVIDESQYAPTAAATVPLVVVATAANKETPQGTIAEGTIPANAGDLYVLTSQRDVLNFFGTPSFYTDTNNTPIHGYELNEYGLQTVYSLLGSTSRAYVIRANIDLGQLVGLSGRPLADPADMTYWLDLTPTRWGLFVWDQFNQEFYATTPIVITDEDDLSGGVPKSSIGSVGTYAVVGTSPSLPVYVKNRANAWVLVGSEDWMESVPAVTSTFVNPTLIALNSVFINDVSVVSTGTTITTFANNINAAGIPGVTAAVVSGRLELYANLSADTDGDSSIIDNGITLANNVGTPLAALGITAGTYYRPAVQQSAHTSVPQWKTTDGEPRPSGSVWVKTSAVNFGASFSVKRYNALTGNWQLLSAPLYANDYAANKAYDPLRGGSGIPVGSTYVQFDTQEASTVTYKVFDRVKTGATMVTGTELAPLLTSTDEFELSFSLPGYDFLDGPYTIPLSGTTNETLASDILALGSPYVGAQVNGDGSISIYHTNGGVIVLKDTVGTPMDDAGITDGNDFCRAGVDGAIVVSNWVETEIAVSNDAPGADPADGTKWYWGATGEADVLIHDGTEWKGYRTVSVDARGFNLTNTDPKGPLFSATAPVEQSDGTALVYGDLWVDTSDLENYPKLYRWELLSGESRWTELDLADQTTENGILFSDARMMSNGIDDVVTGDLPTIEALLTSNYLDLDAPSASLYPRGMLLWNTRRSSFNVKEYRRNYFNSTDFPGATLPAETNAWVTVSGARENGHAFFGRKAQRNVIVAAMRAALDTNTEIREEQRTFNLISAPGYPELIQNMVQLNNDRKQTAFIVGDSPFRVASEGTGLTDWLQNSDLEGVDSEEALVVRDPYVGIWYPSLMGNDLNGNQVAMPASYGVLRMMIRSDSVSYPWFAPAGVRRGTIDNASRLGYLTDTGEFVTIGVRQGVRDILYENSVNPLMQTPETGIVAFGQKTRSASNSALDRINIARLTAYMRSSLDKIVRQFLFEPNDKITRDEVRGVVESFCNDLVAKRALYDYLVVCDESNNTPDRIDRNELYIDIAIEPVKAIEFIYIPIRIKNTGEIG